MPESKDYVQTDEYLTVDGVKKLRVKMDTREFGMMYSRLLDQVEDNSINQHLLNTLGEDLIQEYEQRISQRPTVVAGWR